MQTIHPEILYSVQLIFTVAAFFFLRKYKLIPTTRAAVFVGALIWVVLISVSYWIAGPYSYSAVQTELDFSVPIHQYYASLPSGTRFAHEFAGGVDAFAINQFTGQYISLERLLVSSLPTWLGIAFHKVLLFLVSVAGAYILCRRLTKCDRRLAFAAGAAYSLASDALTIHSFWHGLAIGLLPLAVYLLIVRRERQRYFLGVTLFGAVYAITTTVPVAVLSLVVTLPLAALMIGGGRGILRSLPGLIIVLILILLNWHESMFAMAQISQFTLRQFTGARAIDQDGLFGTFWGIQKNVYMDSNLVFAVASAAVIFLILYDRKNLQKGILYAVAFSLFGFYLFIMTIFPWDKLGLGLVKGLTFNYARHGLPTIMVLLVASVGAYKFRKSDTTFSSGALAVVVISLAFGKLTYYKAYESLTWLSGGGLSLYSLDSLKSPSWKPKEPFRVAAVPFRLPDNALPALGLHSATAIYSLQLASSVKFWSAVTSQSPNLEETKFTVGPSLYARLGEPVGKCCNEYNIDERGVNANLLKIANVRFIVSRNPLTGGGLRKVDGPPDGTLLPRTNTPIQEKLVRYFRWIQNPDKPYVYELPDPTPRIFSAKGIIEMEDNVSTNKFFEVLAKAAPKQNAVLTKNALQSLGGYGVGLKIKEFMVVKNGFDVIVEKGTSGVLIVNIPHLPFWTAHSNGIELPVAPANEIHMAVNIPNSAQLISIRYERPLLREVVLNFLNNKWNKIFCLKSVEQYVV